MLSSGIEWGEFVKRNDAATQFGEAFQEMVKSNLAAILAQREMRRQEQAKREVEKAQKEYDDFKMQLDMVNTLMKQKEMAERAKQWETGMGLKQQQQELQEKKQREQTALGWARLQKMAEKTQAGGLGDILKKYKFQSNEADSLATAMINAYLSGEKETLLQLRNDITSIPNAVKKETADELGINKVITINTTTDKNKLMGLFGDLINIIEKSPTIPQIPKPAALPLNIIDIIKQKVKDKDIAGLNDLMRQHRLTEGDVDKMLEQ